MIYIPVWLDQKLQLIDELIEENKYLHSSMVRLDT